MPEKSPSLEIYPSSCSLVRRMIKFDKFDNQQHLQAVDFEIGKFLNMLLKFTGAPESLQSYNILK